MRKLWWTVGGLVLSLGSIAGCASQSGGMGGDGVPLAADYTKAKAPGASWGSQPAGLAEPDSSQTENARQALAEQSGQQAEGPMDKVFSAVSTSGQKVTSVFRRDREPEPVKDSISVYTKSNPDAKLHVAFALHAESAGKVDVAEKRYQAALVLDKKHLDALLGYARLCDRADRLDDAVALYQRAAKYHPDSAAAYNDLGLCLARQDQYAQAKTAVAKAIELDPKRKLYRNNMATILVELGDRDAALAQLHKAHDEGAAHYNLGFLLQQRGDLNNAYDQFATAARIDPTLHEAQQWLVALDEQLGKSSVAGHGGAEALQTASASDDAEPMPASGINRFPDAADEPETIDPDRDRGLESAFPHEESGTLQLLPPVESATISG